jgi:uncharacterized protein YodC (DUF2158 family)
VKKGELVRLKTGGPSMLVVRVNRASDAHGAPSVDCLWQAADTVSRGKFPIDMLEPVDSYDFCIGATRQAFE